MRVQLEAALGQTSGQGEVWRGRDVASNRQVAVKFVKLPVGPGGRGKEMKRFMREVRCQQQLRHPGIAEILSVNLEDEKPFYVMPLASGSLRQLLPLYPGGMPEELAMTMFFRILDAVQFAHSQGVLHRDIKPENVLIFDDEPVIADFGLGLRLQSGSTTITVAQVGLGTIQYSAPEQLADGHGVTVSADVYSLGAMLFEMLTGAVMWPRLELQKVPAMLRHVIFRATQQRAADRYQSVSDFAQELTDVLHGDDDVYRPVDRLRAHLNAIEAGDGTAADLTALLRLLIEFGDDKELYGEFAAHSSVELMEDLAENSEESFEQVVSGLDAFADDSFPFRFCDVVGDVLADAYQATDRIDFHSVLLRRLMLLGTSHNRFHVRDRATGLIAAAIKDPTHVRLVAQLIRDNPRVHEFMAYGLREHSLPRAIWDALAQSAA